MNKFLIFTLTLFLLLISDISKAQYYLDWSEPTKGNSDDEREIMVVDDDDNVYMSIFTNSMDYPVDSGETLGQLVSLNSWTYTSRVLEKRDSNNKVIFSVILQGEGTTEKMIIHNDRIYTLGQAYTDNNHFETTDGSLPFGNYSYAYRVFSALTGELLFSTIYSPNAPLGGSYNLLLDDNDVYLVHKGERKGHFVSPNGVHHSFNTGAWAVKKSIYYRRYSHDGILKYASYIAGSKQYTNLVALNKGNLCMFGASQSNDLTLVNGTQKSGTVSQSESIYIIIDSTNTIIKSTYFGGALSQPQLLIPCNNGFYFYLRAYNFTNLVSTTLPPSDYKLVKIDLEGTVTYASDVSYSDGYPLSRATQIHAFEGGNLLISYVLDDGSEHPISTNGTVFSGGGSDNFYYILDSNQNLIYSSYLGAPGASSGMGLWCKHEDKMSILVQVQSSKGFPLAGGGTHLQDVGGHIDSSLYPDLYKPYFVTIGSDGKIIYSGAVPSGEGSDGSYLIVAKVGKNKAYFINDLYPKGIIYTVDTDTMSGLGGLDVSYMVMKKGLESLASVSSNTITPATQTKCKYGYADELFGSDAKFPPSAYPDIYTKDGVQIILDDSIVARYQWQTAPSSTGPWSDISAGILRNYLPSIGGIDAYYRRIAKESHTSTLGDTSAVVSVLVNSNTAPTVDAGGIINTCPSVSIGIGGSPSATGGTTPYTYSWDLGAFLNNTNTANPTATVEESTVFELLVTDDNSCRQIDQVVVQVHKADAGPDVGACSGLASKIGGAPIAGLTGVSYSWNPTANLNSSTAAQPMANPGSVTSYILTQTIPKTGGGTCSTTDTTIVTPVGGLSANFAGVDRTLCSYSSTTLGTASVSGFSYSWSPKKSISSSSQAVITYDPDGLLPSPNPFTYYVTARKNGCIFVDDVVVTVIESRAGEDGCGPRYIGVGDRTPLIIDTFAWTKISGTGDFSTGADMDSAISSVKATPSGSTTYRLTATFGSTTCTDDVVVPTCGGGCALNVGVSAKHGCPKKSLSDTVWLYGSGATITDLGPDNFTYSWSPSAGLNSSTGRRVYLTDDVARTYTLTITSTLEAGFSCSNTIDVNGSWSPPSFNAVSDTICSKDTIYLGEAPVADYTYLWIGAELSDVNSSNPYIAPKSTNNYPVKITNDTSGCFTMDTSFIDVRKTIVNAGPDWTICQNAIIQLGTQGIENYTYYWLPVSTWQNGTSQTDAQPEVQVSTNISYNVKATDTISGCIERDTVQVIVSASPTIDAGTDKFVCKKAIVTIGIASQPGVTYSWSPSAGLSCTDCAQPVASPSATTTYTLTATFPNCGSTATDSMIVEVDTFDFVLNDVTYCPSTDFEVYIGDNVPVDANNFYWWKPGADLDDEYARNPLSYATKTTAYLLESWTLNCVYTHQMTVYITDGVNAGEDAVICIDDAITLGDASNSGTLSWSPATGLSCTSCAQPEFTTTTPGTYTFTLSQTSGCSNSSEVTITVAGADEAVFENNHNVCSGECVSVGHNPSIGWTYVWSDPTGALSDIYSSKTEACVSQTTDFALTAISPEGCEQILNTTVVMSPNSAPTLTIPSLSTCIGTNDTLRASISPAGSYTYDWSPATYLSSSYVLTPEVSSPMTGVHLYSLTAINTANGCAGTESTNVIAGICDTLNPLPVELIEYDAEWSNEDAYVHWATALELNNSHFELWRSVDEGEYEFVDHIQSKADNGHSSAVINYSHTDMSIKNRVYKTVYYKLVQFNMDGESEEIGVIVLSTIRSKHLTTMNVYPNPTGEFANLRIAGLNEGIVSVSVTGIDGKVVLAQNIVNQGYVQHRLNLKDLEQGLYIISASDGKSMISKRISVIK